MNPIWKDQAGKPWNILSAAYLTVHTETFKQHFAHILFFISIGSGAPLIHLMKFYIWNTQDYSTLSAKRRRRLPPAERLTSEAIRSAEKRGTCNSLQGSCIGVVIWLLLYGSCFLVHSTIEGVNKVARPVFRYRCCKRSVWFGLVWF